MRMKFKEYVSRDLERRSSKTKKDWKFEVCSLVTEARFYTCTTQKELAIKMKTKQSSIARFENGKQIPSIDFLIRLARAVDTELVLPKFKFIIDREEASKKRCEQRKSRFMI
jgi:transcriptional regulator with XRE-family HTH domain